MHKNTHAKGAVLDPGHSHRQTRLSRYDCHCFASPHTIQTGIATPVWYGYHARQLMQWMNAPHSLSDSTRKYEIEYDSTANPLNPQPRITQSSPYGTGPKIVKFSLNWIYLAQATALKSHTLYCNTQPSNWSYGYQHKRKQKIVTPQVSRQWQISQRRNRAQNRPNLHRINRRQSPKVRRQKRTFTHAKNTLKQQIICTNRITHICTEYWTSHA